VRALLRTGTTIALLGSSGVGKSTLINALLGDQLLATGAVREDDARGRHTTSGRQLVLLLVEASCLTRPESVSSPLDDGAGLARRLRRRGAGRHALPLQRLHP